MTENVRASIKVILEIKFLTALPWPSESSWDSPLIQEDTPHRLGQYVLPRDLAIVYLPP